MGFYVKIDGSKKLCYPLDNINPFDNEQLAAIRELQIAGLAQVEKKMIDGNAELVYAVGGMQPLQEYITILRNNPSNEKEELLRILQRVLKLVQEIEKYPLLTTANLVIDLQYIWIDARGEIYAIYLPLLQDYQNLVESWKRMIQELLTKVESDAGLLFLTKQLRIAEGQSYFSAGEILRQMQIGQNNANPMGNANIPMREVPENPVPSGLNQGQAAFYGAAQVAPMASEPATSPQMPRQAPVPPMPNKVPMSPSNSKPNPNIQMMQAPNHAPQIPHGMANTSPVKKQSKGKFNVTKLIFGHLLILAIAGLMFFGGVLKNEAGEWDIINLLILAVLVIGGLAFVWLKMAVEKGEDFPAVEKQAKQKKPKDKGQKNKPNVPGIGSGGNAPIPPIPGKQPNIQGQQAVKQPQTPYPQPQVAPIPQPQRPESPHNVYSNGPSASHFYEEPMPMAEAEGTMIMGGGNRSQHSEGTVVLQQERGTFLTNKSTGEKRKIMINPYRLGRNGDWKINDSAVSGMHCQIEIQNGNYYLVDIGSKNGTFLNGNRLEQSQYYPLSQGNTIRMGNTEMQFEIF